LPLLTSRHWVSRAVFLRALGVVYAFAFLSLARDGRGLFGARGILPIAAFLDGQRGAFGSLAPLHAPSVFWFSASDGALFVAAWAGVVVGSLLVFGCASSVALAGAWFLWLSFVTTGQAFIGYPCDLLLLEAGFLAILLSPGISWKPRFAPAWPVVFLFRWLAFRALFGAGVARLQGDSCWGSLTCLPEYFETAPGVTLVSFYVHALPLPVHRVLGFLSLFGELVVPFGFFAPRRLRMMAGGATAVLGALSALLTNAQFSSVMILLCSVFCFDDALFERTPIARLVAMRDGAELVRSRFVAVAVACGALFVMSLFSLPRTLAPTPGMEASLEPLHLVNAYGVVEGVERTRTEIVFEGTWDDVAVGPAHWLEYELPCKPGAPARAPCLPSPGARRLDVRLWQAALGDFRREPWVIRVMDDLLRENPVVTSLFARDPFVAKPPRFVRAERYRYRFVSANEPPYWHRERLDEYVRPFSTKDPALYEYLALHGWLRDAGDSGR
jgi:hypothetical protein